VLGTGERHQHRPVPLGCADHHRHVARCVPQQGHQPGIFQQPVRRVDDQQLGVLLAGQASQIRPGSQRREHRGTGRDTPPGQLGPLPVEHGSRPGQRRRLGNGDCHDQLVAVGAAHEGLGERDQARHRRRVERRHQDGAHVLPCVPGAETGGRGRCAAQRRVLPQDRPLQVAQLGTRLDTQLLDEGIPPAPVRGQCVGLPSTAVQRTHEQPERALP
jgi:hypothetical protein